MRIRSYSNNVNLIYYEGPKKINRPSRSGKRQRSRFLFGRCSVRISAGTSDILTGISCFSSVLPYNCRDITSIGSRLLPSKYFLLHESSSYYHTIRRHTVSMLKNVTSLDFCNKIPRTTSDMYLGGIQFGSGPSHHLYCLGHFVFLLSPDRVPGYTRTSKLPRTTSWFARNRAPTNQSIANHFTDWTVFAPTC
jgi:hypothetical protein